MVAPLGTDDNDVVAVAVAVTGADDVMVDDGNVSVEMCGALEPCPTMTNKSFFVALSWVRGIWLQLLAVVMVMVLAVLVLLVLILGLVVLWLVFVSSIILIGGLSLCRSNDNGVLVVVLFYCQCTSSSACIRYIHVATRYLSPSK